MARTFRGQSYKDFLVEGLFDSLGVRMDSVPVGRSEWPLLTGAVAPAQTKEGTAAAAAACRYLRPRHPEAQALNRALRILSHEVAASCSRT